MILLTNLSSNLSGRSTICNLLGQLWKGNISLHIMKRFRRRRRVKNREGEGGGGRIIVSPPNAGLF